MYLDEARYPSVSAKDRVIAKVLDGAKVNRKSFENIDDATNITRGMAISYFHPKKNSGTPLDGIAMSASGILNHNGDGTEISDQDVADFMKRYKTGPRTMSTPAGNNRLRDISNQHYKVTGVGLNKKTAQDRLNRAAKLRQNFDANKAVFSDSFLQVAQMADTPGAIDFDDPDIKGKLTTLYGLSEEEYVFLTNFYGKPEQQADGRTANESGNDGSQSPDAYAQEKGTPIGEGAAIPQRPGSAHESEQQKIVSEIKGKPLTHVHGLNMGSGVAKGTYLSTEENNRYATPGTEVSTAEVRYIQPAPCPVNRTTVELK